MKQQITAKPFDGWIFTCPECNHEMYIRWDELAFDPEDDNVHFIACEGCLVDYEIITDEIANE